MAADFQHAQPRARGDAEDIPRLDVTRAATGRHGLVEAELRRADAQFYKL
jgi:hypothetical protein